MSDNQRRSARLMLHLPIRVRGMSASSKFFDEATETILISEHGFMTRIQNLVELDSEVHVVATKLDVAGHFRVVWVNTRQEAGYHHVGLELLQAEGDMWGIRFPATLSTEEEATCKTWLECTRCHQRCLAPVPLCETEHLGQGVMVARACDKCRGTTSWAWTEEARAEAAPEPEVRQISPPPEQPAPAAEVVPPSTPAPPAEAATRREREDRGRGRAPIKMRIKIIREIYGTPIEDICDTINVSRNGACFLTEHNYQLGEMIKVVLPYEENGLALPVRAKVVRKDDPRGMYNHLVAIHMESGVYVPPSEAASEGKRVEHRSRSRVPLKLPIKIIRRLHGQQIEDMAQTINISRGGVYFHTFQDYEVGEEVQVIVPYKPGDIAVPVTGRVLRQDRPKDSAGHAVALRLGEP